MKHFFTLSFLLFSFAIGTFAQTDKSKTILDAVSSNLKALKSLKANYTLSISKTKETKTGNITMKGNKYLLTIGANQVIHCDGKTIYTHSKKEKEVTITDVDPTDNTFSPTKLFSNFYSTEYTSKFVKEKVANGTTLATIELTPINKKKGITKIEVTIDKTKNIIVSGKVYEKSGNILSYAFTNLVANPNVLDNIFTFDQKKNPGVEVIDLR
jgi:outer membrane lipoprotein carrier protein